MNNKKNKKTILTIVSVFIASALVAVGIYVWKNSEPLNLNEEQEISLLEAQRDAVASSGKPADIIEGLTSRYRAMSDKGRSQASEISYRSVQQAALYYNNASTVMAGEVSYARQNENPLTAGDHSDWVDGYISDIENQYLVPLPLNKDFILALPDFKKLRSDIYEYAESDLQALLDLGVDIQSRPLFKEDGTVNFDNTAENYEAIVVASADLLQENEESLYLQDMMSLARIHHEILFGYIQTNEVIQQEGVYIVSNAQIEAIEDLSSSEHSLAKEANEYLEEFDEEKYSINENYVFGKSQDMILQYGSSSYWQSTQDMMSSINQIMRQRNQPVREEDNDSEEEGEDVN